MLLYASVGVVLLFGIGILIYKNWDKELMKDLRAVVLIAWGKVAKWLPTPYNLMRLYADGQNNVDEFVKLHSRTAFVCFSIMLAVVCAAFLADWDVLFGTEYNAHKDYSRAWTYSLLIALIIQGGIWHSGGMMVKLYVNGLHKKTVHKLKDNIDNAIQFKIHTLVFLACMGSTLYLSFQTYESSKAKGAGAMSNVVSSYTTKKDSVAGGTNQQAAALYAHYQRDSQAIADNWNNRIDALFDHYEGKKEEKLGERRAGRVSWGQYAKDTARYFRKQHEETKPFKDTMSMQLADLHKNYVKRRNWLASKLENTVSNIDSLLGLEKNDLLGSIENNAQVTRGRNIILNGISFLLNLVLIFFARGANRIGDLGMAAQTTANATQVGVGVGGGGNGDGGDLPKEDEPTPKQNKQQSTTPEPKGEPTPKKENGEEDKTPKQKDNKEQENGKTPLQREFKGGDLPTFSGKGGTVEGNKDNVFQVLQDGSVVLLYNGASSRDFKDYKYYRNQIANRIKKYDKAKESYVSASDDNAKKRAEKAMQNNLAWIRLMEDKCLFIQSAEKLQGGEIKRKSFDRFTD